VEPVVVERCVLKWRAGHLLLHSVNRAVRKSGARPPGQRRPLDTRSSRSAPARGSSAAVSHKMLNGAGPQRTTETRKTTGPPGSGAHFSDGELRIGNTSNAYIGNVRSKVPSECERLGHHRRQTGCQCLPGAGAHIRGKMPTGRRPSSRPSRREVPASDCQCRSRRRGPLARDNATEFLEHRRKPPPPPTGQRSAAVAR
jgi:hypothetical protein